MSRREEPVDDVLCRVGETELPDRVERRPPRGRSTGHGIDPEGHVAAEPRDEQPRPDEGRREGGEAPEPAAGDREDPSAPSFLASTRICARISG